MSIQVLLGDVRVRRSLLSEPVGVTIYSRHTESSYALLNLHTLQKYYPILAYLDLR